VACLKEAGTCPELRQVYKKQNKLSFATGGRASYLKQEGKVSDFQNKTGTDETRHEQNVNRDK